MTYIHKGKLSDGCKAARRLFNESRIIMAKRAHGLWLIRVIEVKQP